MPAWAPCGKRARGERHPAGRRAVENERRRQAAVARDQEKRRRDHLLDWLQVLRGDGFRSHHLPLPRRASARPGISMASYKSASAMLFISKLRIDGERFA